MSGERPRPRRRIVVFTLAAAFVVWNGVFDARIAEATRQFVRLREADPAPHPVRIDVPMHAAAVRCAGEASVAGGAALAIGLAAAAFWPIRARR